MVQFVGAASEQITIGPLDEWRKDVAIAARVFTIRGEGATWAPRQVRDRGYIQGRRLAKNRRNLQRTCNEVNLEQLAEKCNT